METAHLRRESGRHRGRGSLHAIAGALARQRSIKHAVDWLAAHDPPIAPAGMVTQDEFSHDILVAYPGGLWLVYDTT